MHGAQKIGKFRLKLPFIFEQYHIGPQLLRITNKKSYVADQFVLAPMTSSDLERWDARGQVFPADLHKYAHIV